MNITHIINVDTRDGWLADKTIIGDYGDISLGGCRSVDFLTDATIARNRFLESPLITNRRTVLCVDVHNPIPDEVMDCLNTLKSEGEITDLVLTPHAKTHPKWGSLLYIRSLALAGGGLVCHWDGDAIAYRSPEIDVFAEYLDHLNSGHAYVCQQTPLEKDVHNMTHASTRFFLCKREALDLVEAERLLDDNYRNKKFNNRHLACLEHYLGAMCGDKVLYPPEQPNRFLVWNWVNYYAGTIKKLNAMSYNEIKKYVFEDCGGLLGASDMIGKPL